MLTDLYQLTMAQAYFQSGRSGSATFSLFIRSYPSNRGYFVSAGLCEVLDYLQGWEFDAQAIDFLNSKRLFADEFLDFLKQIRFTGDVWAIPEGRLFFTDEPIIEVTAPIIEAQIVETFIINQINLQSLTATKAARCFHAAGGRGVVDFALRRTHGIDAGMKVARSSYIAGFGGTSNVLAGKLYGIPIVGTMAHSFVASFDSEIDAFRAYAKSFPDNSILLIDTYDTIAGAGKAVQIAREMADRGQRLHGVRIDSGDLAELTIEVRKLFDEAGLKDVKIIASGGLDEYDLADFTAANIPCDSYGVGTKMGTSSDAPWSDMAYKLVDYERRPVLKLSTGKASWPAEKQVFRFCDDQNRLRKDLIALRDEQNPDADALLQKVMDGGKMTTPSPTIDEIRNNFLTEFKRLPDSIKAIKRPANYPVEFSSQLTELRRAVEKETAQA